MYRSYRTRSVIKKKHDVHALRKELQELVGNQPIFRVKKTFRNWADDQTIHDLIECSPTTLEQVQKVVKAAASLELKVRCVGAGHSWGPLFPDPKNVLMRVKDLAHHSIHRIQLKLVNGRNLVTVGAGVTVEELKEFELKHGVNLPANVILTDIVYGGVVSPGCHGTGWDCKAIVDYVVEMRIVDSKGTLRTFRKTDPSCPNNPDANDELFKAVQTNLGMFGIIYDLTFDLPSTKVVKAQNDFDMSVDDLFYNPQKMKNLVLGHYSSEIFWFPFNSHTLPLLSPSEIINLLWSSETKLDKNHWNPKHDKLWVRKVSELSSYKEKDITGSHHSAFLDPLEWLAEHISVPLLRALPEWLTPYFTKATFEGMRATNPSSLTQRLPDAIHYLTDFDYNGMKVCDMECCFSIPNDDFSVVTTACQAVIDIVQQRAKDGRYPLSVVMEMRFMADSDAYMCPANVGSPANGGTGHTCYLEVLSRIPTPGWKEFCNEVFQKWKVFKPAIHYAKSWTQIDGAVDYIKEQTVEQRAAFVAQLKASNVDPKGMFRNSALNDIFFN